MMSDLTNPGVLALASVLSAGMGALVRYLVPLVRRVVDGDTPERLRITPRELPVSEPSTAPDFPIPGPGPNGERVGPLGMTEEQTRIKARERVEGQGVFGEVVLWAQACVDAWDRPRYRGSYTIPDRREPEPSYMASPGTPLAARRVKLKATCGLGCVFERNMSGIPQSGCVECGAMPPNEPCPDCGQFPPSPGDRDRRIAKAAEPPYDWPDTWCPGCVGLVDKAIPLRSDPALMSLTGATPKQDRAFRKARQEAMLASYEHRSTTEILNEQKRVKARGDRIKSLAVSAAGTSRRPVGPVGTPPAEIYENMQEAMEAAKAAAAARAEADDLIDRLNVNDEKIKDIVRQLHEAEPDPVRRAALINQSRFPEGVRDQMRQLLSLDKTGARASVEPADCTCSEHERDFAGRRITKPAPVDEMRVRNY